MSRASERADVADDMVTVRFALADAHKTRRHPEEWAFYSGTALASFAYQPFMWWPEGAPIGLPIDLPPGWKAEVTGTYPSSPSTVTLRLPRAALARETRTPYTLVEG